MGGVRVDCGNFDPDSRAISNFGTCSYVLACTSQFSKRARWSCYNPGMSRVIGGSGVRASPPDCEWDWIAESLVVCCQVRW